MKKESSGLKISKNLQNKQNNLFYRPTDLDESVNDDINYEDVDLFLKMLYEKNDIKNSKPRDINYIKQYLDGKKIYGYRNFMYEEAKSKNDIDVVSLLNEVDPSHSADAFVISNSGIEPDKFNTSLNYRITLRNSSNLKNEDVLEFIKVFKEEANKRK